jgi:hypothetical protein
VASKTICRWLLGSLLSVSASFGGPVWFEIGSAGRLPATAQTAIGTGPLDVILGNLESLTEADMFLIWIVDPLVFSAITVDTGFNVNDPQIFLFDNAGLGVYMNDDYAGGGGQSQLPAGHALGPARAGLYYLAIGWWDNEPLSAAGRVFADGSDVMGPDPVGGASPVIGWNDDVTGRIDLPTLYQIDITGAELIPEPRTWLLLGAGLAALALRRRKYSRRYR